MRLIINGEPRETEATTITEFLVSRQLHACMVVVEHNGEIVPRDRYDQTPLNADDTLEIVQMMAGG